MENGGITLPKWAVHGVGVFLTALIGWACWLTVTVHEMSVKMEENSPAAMSARMYAVEARLAIIEAKGKP